MRCAVFDCNKNNNNGIENSIRFYRFPTDKVLRKQWVHFCRRKDQFNVETSRICSAHFAPDGIERNLQFEMGFSQKNGYKLKPGTIPTIYPKAENVSVSYRFKRIKTQATQEMTQQSSASAKTTATQEAENEPTVAEEEESIENTISTVTIMQHIKSLENEVKTLKRKVIIQSKKEKNLEHRIRYLENLLKTPEFEHINMDD